MTHPYQRCDGSTRRDLLRVGGLTAFGLSLGNVVGLKRASGAVAPAAKAKNCILIWLDGGPSHLETFDLKPEAPAEVRGPLRPVSTSVPGIHVSECLPELAKRMQDVAIIRSVTSPLGEHNFGTHYMLTGYKPTPVLEYPSFHAVGAYLQKQHGVLPANVAVPDYRVGGAKFSGAGFLPINARPFSVGSDPASPGFQVRDLDLHHGIDVTRLERRQFVNTLNQLSDLLEASGQPAADPELEQAYRLITSREAKQAFDLADEPPRVRQRYGSKTVGQSCLLARRLIERGVPFVTVNQRGWDTHNNMFTRLKEGYTGARKPVGLIPSLDLAFSALITDLKERGLFDETLIVVMGEFGRTPKINSLGGRDHWPRVFSVALAGGGVRGGQTIGESDAVGEGPKDRPVTPADLACTVFSLLGISPSLELHTADGRPVRIADPESAVISEVMA